MEEQTYYQVLGVPRDADEREIKRAYYRLARELHPDKAGSPERAREMEEKFAIISTAYNLLKDSGQRAEYDRKRFGASNVTTPPLEAKAPAAAPGAGAKPASKKKGSSPEDAGKPAVEIPMSSGLAGEAKRINIAQKAYVMGVKLLREKDYAKASEYFEAAIQNNPNEAQYHARLAMALIEAKKSLTRAIEAGEKAIELDRYNLEYKFNLGNIYTMIGSKSRALTIYEEILKWEPENEIARQMLRELNKKDSILNKLSPPGSALDSIRKKLGPIWEKLNKK